MKTENKILLLNGLVVGSILIGFVWFTVGCAQLNVLGGRSQSIVNVYTQDTDSEQDLEADSDTSDILNNLLQNATIPFIGGDKIPTIPTIPDPDQPPVIDPTDPADPADPSDPPADDPATPPAGDNTFLWKPVADSGGNLVVLTPASLEGIALTVNGEPLAAAGRANGNRQHWRGDRPGAQYTAPAVVKMLGLAPDAQEYTWTVPDTAARWTD